MPLTTKANELVPNVWGVCTDTDNRGHHTAKELCNDIAVLSVGRSRLMDLLQAQHIHMIKNPTEDKINVINEVYVMDEAIHSHGIKLGGCSEEDFSNAFDSVAAEADSIYYTFEEE